MKTVVDMTGSGIGPRGSADVRIMREFPDLVGAEIYKVDAAFRNELRNRTPRNLDNINVTTVTNTKVPMLIAFFNPRYDDAEFPSRDYPDAETIMKEFNIASEITEKWLKKSLMGVKLMNKFRNSKYYSYLNVAWDCVREEWCVHINAGFRNLPENEGIKTPNNVNQAESYVERHYSDDDVDIISDDEVKLAISELHFLVRNNKYILDAQDILRERIRDFESQYLTKHSIFGSIDSVSGFRGNIKLFSIGTDPINEVRHFNTAKEAFDIVSAMTIQDIIDFVTKNDFMLSPRPKEVEKTKEQAQADKKKHIAQMKKRTEVKFEDFLIDLKNLADKQ